MTLFPFTALVNQEVAKEALLVAVLNPTVHGVLLLGSKGTGKTTMVRSLSGLLPDKNVIELPVGSGEDMVLGTVDAEKTLASGELSVKPGILSRADQAILYIDEVNLLPDHLVDVILDAAATGKYRLEREGISAEIPSRFILIGSMNPEEGWLRPQLLDRFGLAVHVRGLEQVDDRAEVFSRCHSYSNDPEGFAAQFREQQEALCQRLQRAAGLLPDVELPGDLLRRVIEMVLEIEISTHRAELTACQAAITRAAINGRKQVEWEDLQAMLPLALQHRLGEAETQTRLTWDRLEQRIFEGSQETEQSKPGWLPSPFYRKKKAKTQP
ncbi:MAG: ATP-binding protein [Desulfobacterales bacterium]|nr:ATP-binding protein [Desulfobacterales bacterium]